MILKQDRTDGWAVGAGLAGAAVSLAVAVADAVGGRSWGIVGWLVVPVLAGVDCWGLRVAWLAVRRARRLRTLTEAISPIRAGTPEWRWFERAWLAASRTEREARRVLPGAVAGGLTEQVDAAARQLYALAGEVSTLSSKAAEIDSVRLQAEAGALRAGRVELSGEAAVAVDRSLAALEESQAVSGRLAAAGEVAARRLAAGTHQLESMRARVIELGGLLRATPAVPPELDDLRAELEGLRHGLVETARITRRALGGTAGGTGGDADEVSTLGP